jgi:hypothetical protein
MSITKESIIADIQRTASENGGVPLGIGGFRRECGISPGAWRGKYRRNWSDALKEAGFEANRPNEAHERSFLIFSLVQLTRKNGRFPTYVDMRMEKVANKSFPDHMPLQNLGTLAERIELVRQYATDNAEYEDILKMLPPAHEADRVESQNEFAAATKDGFVYLALHGTRRGWIRR